MRCFALIVLSAISLYGQDDLAHAAKNPYDVARFLSSQKHIAWDQVWKSLRIAAPPDMPDCSENHPCSVNAITILDPSQVILVVEGSQFDGYLRFLPQDSDWRCAGAYHNIAKNYGHRYEVLRLPDKPFLGLFEQGASGSGWESEVEELFDLTLPDFEPVFVFTTRGWANLGGASISRTIHGDVDSDTADTLKLSLEIHFSMYDTVDLGFAKYQATYTRAAGEKRYSIQRVDPFLDVFPPISASEFENLGDLVEGVPTNERLLVYTLPRLMEIASGSDADARGWLRSVLTNCKDTPEKQHLLALLDPR